MSFILHPLKEINCKIVYCGPGLSGKTTNIQYIFNNTSPESRGKLISISPEASQALFFDFLPIFPGVLNGYRLKFHLYTVPGNIFYEESRKLILKGVDGIVFVADSQVERMDANIETLEDVKRDLKGYDIDMGHIPLVFQYNKRDLPNIMDVEEMETLLNAYGTSSYEAVAVEGIGVFETLKDITRKVIGEIKKIL